MPILISLTLCIEDWEWECQKKLLFAKICMPSDEIQESKVIQAWAGNFKD